MTTIELYTTIRKAIKEELLMNGDLIKIENNEIFWSNDGGHTWELCE